MKDKFLAKWMPTLLALVGAVFAIAAWPIIFVVWCVAKIFLHGRIRWFVDRFWYYVVRNMYAFMDDDTWNGPY